MLQQPKDSGDRSVETETCTSTGGGRCGGDCGSQPSVRCCGSPPSLLSLLLQWGRVVPVVARALWSTYSLEPFCRSMWTGLMSSVLAMTARWRYESRAVNQLATARLRVCGECPFFNSRYQTCGTPGQLHPTDDGLIQVGCWCFLPLAALDPEKACWAREAGLGVGWPEEEPFPPRRRLLRPKAPAGGGSASPTDRHPSARL